MYSLGIPPKNNYEFRNYSLVKTFGWLKITLVTMKDKRLKKECDHLKMAKYSLVGKVTI